MEKPYCADWLEGWQGCCFAGWLHCWQQCVPPGLETDAALQVARVKTRLAPREAEGRRDWTMTDYGWVAQLRAQPCRGLLPPKPRNAFHARDGPL